MRWRVSLVTTLVLVLAATAAEPPAPTRRLGEKIDVRLTSLDGKPVLFSRDRAAFVAVFLSFECPMSNSYVAALNELAGLYAPRRVAFVGILPTTDDVTALVKQAGEFKFDFPLCRDADLAAARAFDAKTVPEAFVLDSNLVLRYRGRIDDRYAQRLAKKQTGARRHDLREALDELLAGKAVSQPASRAVGCPIIYPTTQPATGKITYHRDVVPILQTHCQGCHRPGEVGPFSLLTYKQAVTWADDIKEYTRVRRMPPWRPSEGVAFHGERRMNNQEIATLAAWVDGGTPEGDPKDAPPPARFTDGWQLGTPDVILEPKEDMIVGANGGDLFRCFVYPLDLSEDRFVTAYEVRPGNPRVVHHTLHFLDTQGRARKLEEREQQREKKPDERDRGPGYNSRMGPGFFPPSGDAGGWAPGLRPHHLAEGVGWFIPKGSDLVVQIHYHRTGRVEKDRTRVGLYFARKPASKPLQPVVVAGRFLSVPANVKDHKIDGDSWVAQDCTVYAVTPHMHLLGKSIKISLTPPGGQAMTLINIPEWDYNWQETYFLKEPLKLPEGTKVSLEAVYDNSAANPNNPFDPPRRVFLGEQTTNEMCFGFLGVTTAKEAAGFRLSPGGFVIRRIGRLPSMPSMP